MPLSVPGFVITISRVGPGVAVSIREVRLRIPVRVIPVCVVRLRRAVGVVLAAVIALRITIRVRPVTIALRITIGVRPVTIIGPSLVNHVRPGLIDHDPTAMRANHDPTSLTESGNWEDCAQDERTNRSMKHFRREY